MKKQKLEIEDIKVEVKNKPRKKRGKGTKAIVIWTGGSGAPAIYDEENSHGMQVQESKDEVIEENLKEAKPIPEPQLSFFQRHKLKIILTIVVVVIIAIGFAIGYRVEKNAPKN